MASKCTAVGIDLGTTNSCVAIWRNGTVEIIANEAGNRLTPSVVAFTDTECFVGDSAKAQAIQNHSNTVYGVKRLMGRKFHDEFLQEDIKTWPFSVVCENDRPKIQVMYKNERKSFLPEEISAKILLKLKETAEARLEHEVKDAVITVPAYFNNSQRNATIDAGRIAGLNVLHILNEPTAAAIAYGMDNTIGGGRNVLVYDLGGGTFDVAIMEFHDKNFTVKAVGGDTHLGGEDIDRRLVDYLVEEFKLKHNKDISTNKNAMSRLKVYCEIVKRRLSTEPEISLYKDALLDSIDLKSKLSQSRFNEINKELFEKTITTVQDALRDAEMKKSGIDDVLLVGGSTRIPKIQTRLQEFFDGKKLSRNINQDEAVAYGAAVRAALLQGIKSEAIRNLNISDVTPLSLGIDTRGDIASVIIKRNTVIPTKQTQRYETCIDNQVAFSITVFEGERALVQDNTLLGNFRLEGFSPKPKGVVKMDVTFEIDVNGILTVSAVEPSSQIKDGIKITKNQGQLAEIEIVKMIQDAARFKADDEKQKKRASSKNNLEDYIYIIESNVADTTYKISPLDKQKMLDECKVIAQWLKANQLYEFEDYEMKRKQLEQNWNKITKK